MAYSYIIVEFIEVPDENEYIGIDEVLSGYGLNEIFKNTRLTSGQTKIPESNEDKYGMNVAEGISYDDIGIEYTPIGGTSTRSPLSGFPAMDQPDGSTTFEVCSETAVTLYDVLTNAGISWPHGSFEVIGSCDGYFDGFISENYKDALLADYNTTAQFTIENTNGIVGSGLGTVKITANFHNAVFSAEEYDFATITIVNEIVAPENNVLPDSLTFNVNTQVTGAPSKNLEIVSETDTWTITDTLPDWLIVSDMSGNLSGEVQVTPVNYALLSVGAHLYTMIFTIGDDVFEVEITLNVSANIRNPFQNGSLYFTKEDVSLGFTSDLLNTYIHFEFEIKVFKINSNTPTIYIRKYNFPLFKGKGDFYVGEIVEGLLDEINNLKDFVPDFKSNYVKKQFKPAEVKISYKEKQYSNDLEISSGEIEMFKMIKGYRPFMTSGELALLTVSQQEITRISPSSIIGTSFVYIGKPRIVVKKNNVIIEDFEVDNSEDEIIYSYYRFNNNFKPGDSIEILIIKGLETRSQRFLVFKNGKENTFLFFENSNGLVEPYEFTGRRRVSSAIKHTTTPKVKTLYSIDKKVFTENNQGLIINTGQLLKTDHKIILSIIRSVNVWCCLDHSDGQYILVDATTTKLTDQDTDNSEEDFDVEFNILEDTDASIYPQ